MPVCVSERVCVCALWGGCVCASQVVRL
jgi:hypothetical protein